MEGKETKGILKKNSTLLLIINSTSDKVILYIRQVSMYYSNNFLYGQHIQKKIMVDQADK